MGVIFFPLRVSLSVSLSLSLLYQFQHIKRILMTFFFLSFFSAQAATIRAGLGEMADVTAEAPGEGRR